MILEISFKNYRMFKNSNVITFKADRRTKYLSSNIEDVNNVGVLKAIALYGPNNAGKSNVISLLKNIKKILIGETNFECNRKIFNDEPVTEAYIVFSTKNQEWLKYEFVFNSETSKFEKEKLYAVTYYDNGTTFNKTIFEKDIDNRILKIYDTDNSTLLNILPMNKPFLHTISFDADFAQMKQWKDALEQCSNDIVFLKMFNIPIQKTIDMLKSCDQKKINFINSFVKSADLSINDFSYDENSELIQSTQQIDEKVLEGYQGTIDTFKLNTTYGNATVPSILFDSTGTKKVEAIASYIYECITDNKLLVVDELDNGLHFTITRAIVNIFNSMCNNGGQILFTAHDLLLIDSKNLLRKDQIYFLNTNGIASSLLSLKTLTTQKTGLREGESLLKRYNHGDFGAVPLPDFTKEIIGVKI